MPLSAVLNDESAIGSKPVWIHFAVDNPAGFPLGRMLSIETACLDHIEVYFQHRGKTDAAYRAGDERDFMLRPVARLLVQSCYQPR